MPHHSTTRFDLIVIGGGPSGSIVAEGAVAAGMTVALIERDQLGGTCLNYGCDPTNVLARAGELLSLMRHAGPLGIAIPDMRLDWAVLRAYIEGMIDEVREGDGVESVREKGICLYQGHARFQSRTTVEVNGEVHSADRVVIAAGGVPVIPDIPGLAETGYLTNRDVFTLEALPRSLAIIGGGPNAMEFAQAYLNFGLEVSVVTAERRILPEEDDEIAEELARLLRRDGMVIHADVTEIRATRAGSGERCVLLTDDDGSVTEIEVDAILVAVGQRPAVDGLGLEVAGIRYSPEGIDVDARLRTSVPHVFAIGDVTGIGSHTHVADYQAQVALHNILHPDAPKDASYEVVPWKVFTQPEIGRVGLTERAARAAGHDVVAASMPHRDLPRAVSLNQRDGLAKLVVDRQTRQILGGHVLGAYASEVVAEVALAMQHRLPVTAIGETMHVHPTMSEGVYWVAHDIREMLLTDPPPAP